MQIDTLLISCSPKLNQAAIAWSLLRQAQLALRKDTVLLVSTSAANKMVYDKAGFQDLHRIIHITSKGENVMLWAKQSPLPSPVLKRLCDLDGRNPERHPVVWGCCTRDCHAYGIFLCPQVSCVVSAVQSVHATGGELYLALPAALKSYATILLPCLIASASDQ